MRTIMEDGPQQFEVVFRSPIRKDCVDRALVLHVAGIRYTQVHEAGEFMLVVTVESAARSRAELQEYDLENPPSPKRAPMIVRRANGWAGVVAYVVLLVVVFAFDRNRFFDLDWHSAGRTDAILMRQGQWWRAVTALSLHADLAHLFGNIAIGGLIGLFAGQLLGSGLAWFTIFVGGIGGNMLNAWIRPGTHFSVGASTAVFAALGLIAAYSWRIRYHDSQLKFQRWAPLIAAVILLGYLGAGGERTDVGAHVAGFGVGIVLGAILGIAGDRIHVARTGQLILGICAVAVMATAWLLAL